jgi:ribosome-binding ATPase YchF (GTP1/OBG family)
VKLGLIGLPQSGKTTLFQILTGSPAPVSGKIENRLGIARIPDERLGRLTKAVGAKKTTEAIFDIVDPGRSFPAPGPRQRKGEPDPNEALSNADALILVVRVFANDTVPHPDGSIDAERDRRRVADELVLSDLVVVEGRLEKIAKLEKVGKKVDSPQEKPLLLRVKEALEGGTPLRDLDFSFEEEKTIRGFSLLSRLPLIIVYNISEGSEISPAESGRRTVTIQLPARAELEVSRLPAEERPAFRELFSIPEAGLTKLLHSAADALDILTFFTAGPPEARAWHLRRGGTAVEAAGKVHTDIARGFIRAEVVSCEHLLEAGSWAAAREKGWFRLEGRDHEVQEGDVLNILFNQ